MKKFAFAVHLQSLAIVLLVSGLSFHLLLGRCACPAIAVYSEVVCSTNDPQYGLICGIFRNGNLQNQKIAYGVPVGGQCPTFCYRVIVTNTGNCTLSGVTVFATGDLGGSIAGCFPFPFTLPPGSSAQGCVNLVQSCANNTTVVTALGSGATASDTNSVFVGPFDLLCRLFLSTNGGSSFAEYHAALTNCAQVAVNSNYVVQLQVSNPGPSPLPDIYAVDVGTSASLCAGGRDACLGAYHLDLGPLVAGGVTNIFCTNTCARAGTNNFAVDADVVCGYTCTPVVVARSSCDACLVCSVPSPPTLPLFGPPHLLNRTNLVLTWSGGGTLQCASNLDGPWKILTNVASPYTNSTTEGDPRLFFRVQQ